MVSSASVALPLVVFEPSTQFPCYKCPVEAAGFALGYNSNNLKESPADAGFDPAEKFRRDQGNENDGGLLRHVYESDGLPRERGRIVAFEHNRNYTYAAADITRGLRAAIDAKRKQNGRFLLFGSVSGARSPNRVRRMAGGLTAPRISRIVGS
jgi:hypothetical protein